MDHYVKVIEDFIMRNEIHSVVDLGCGDFSVARKYVDKVDLYIGIDIVNALIDRNRKEFGDKKIRFMKLDIVEDDLPDADLCLVRQVMQHMTNGEISKTLNKLKKYRSCIITEHVYRKELTTDYNRQINHNRHNRRAEKSGVYLEEPPFSADVSIIDTMEYNDKEDIIMYLLSDSFYK